MNDSSSLASLSKPSNCPKKKKRRIRIRHILVRVTIITTSKRRITTKMMASMMKTTMKMMSKMYKKRAKSDRTFCTMLANKIIKIGMARAKSLFQASR